VFRRRARTAVAVAANVDAFGHVEAVRCGWEAFNHRDFAGAVRYLHPDGEAFPTSSRRDPRGGGNAGRLRGRDEVSQFLEKMSNTWQHVTVELREVIVAPDGRLLAVESWHIQVHGIDVEAMIVTVYAFRDGLVARLAAFLDREEALDAVGLGE